MAFNPREQPASVADAPSVTVEEFGGLFEVGEQLGRGGFSAVMRGTRLATGEAVALKMAEARRASEVDEEIRVWRMINHERCLCLLEVYDVDPYLVLVTELCEGGSLLDRLAGATDFIAEAQAQRLACEVLDAVLYLHGVGIAHRDIKPANVLCTLPTQIAGAAVEDMHVKLADFGLSKAFDAAAGAAFTGIVGTAEYMAPELVAEIQRQQKGGAPGAVSHSEKVDLWAVGCLVYELLSGKPPFFSQSDKALHRKIAAAPLEFPPAAFGNVPG